VVTADTDIVASADAFVPGTVLAGRFRVEATLGVGGSSRVLRARHVELDQPVAIKLLRDELLRDVEHIRRFVREAQAASRLTSEHVVRIRDVGRLEDGEPYIVMELLEGVDVAQQLAKHGRFDASTATDVLLQACRGLAEAHAMGMVHRDIKPSNLFLATRNDGSQIVKVLDFGIAKVVTQTEMGLTSTMDVLGTPRYMSPEQTRSARTVDARSDIWSLGAVLYELVEGTPPFEANSFAELCVKIATESPPAIKRVPKLAKIATRCLQQEPDDRYQNVAELAQDLAAAAPSVAATEHVAAIRHSLGVSKSARRHAHGTRWLLLGALATAIATAAVVVIVKDHAATTPPAAIIAPAHPPAAAAPPSATAGALVEKTVETTPETTPEPQPPAIVDKVTDTPPAKAPSHKKKHPPTPRPPDPAGSAKPPCAPYDTTGGC
jgi:serine/threonine-protein kinase